jgi:hypothetical protein
MHLSKQEYSKLSRKQQKEFSQVKQKKPKKRVNNPPRKGGSNSSRNSGKQASVAAAYATRNVGKSPEIKGTRDSCRISHREFIGNIVGNDVFIIRQTLAVNPGLSATFPWLSIMAQGWEEYEFKSLRFCYYTRTGSNTNGSVMIAPDYDAADATPVTEAVITSYEGIVEDAPWKDMCCVLKPQLLKRAFGRHYIRTGPLLQNQDIKTYDVANLFTAVVDGSPNAAWGKLWVEYTVDFFVPQLPPGGATQLIGGSFSGGGTITPANPLGNAATMTAASSGVVVNNNSQLTIQEAGEYLMDTAVNGTGVLGITMTPALNCVTTLINTAINAAGTAQLASWKAVAQGPGPMLINMATTATTITASGLQVAGVPLLSI